MGGNWCRRSCRFIELKHESTEASQPSPRRLRASALRLSLIDRHFLAGFGGAVDAVDHFLDGHAGFAGGFEGGVLEAGINKIAQLDGKQAGEVTLLDR